MDQGRPQQRREEERRETQEKGKEGQREGGGKQEAGRGGVKFRGRGGAGVLPQGTGWQAGAEPSEAHEEPGVGGVRSPGGLFLELLP